MTEPGAAGPHRIVRTDGWARLSTGAAVEAFTLRAPDGAEARVTPWGATLVSLEMPDGGGRPEPVVLELERPEDYEANPHYLGSTVGRYANRVRNGRFVLAGRTHRLERRGPHHLHGGPAGFSHRLWRTVAVEADRGWARVVFALESRDGDAGFPGRLRVSAEYHLAGTVLTLRHRAETDAPTHVNLTNHAYLNLRGAGDVRDHLLSVQAGVVLPLDGERLPTAERLPVAGTPFDLRNPRRIGDAVASDHPQIRIAGGFDHSWLLEDWRPDRPELREAAELVDPSSRRRLRLATTLPAIHVYTAAGLAGTRGTGGRPFPAFGGLCLETQFPADAPNRPDLPSTRLDPGTAWEHVTRFAFDVV